MWMNTISLFAPLWSERQINDDVDLSLHSCCFQGQQSTVQFPSPKGGLLPAGSEDPCADSPAPRENAVSRVDTHKPKHDDHCGQKQDCI